MSSSLNLKLLVGIIISLCVLPFLWPVHELPTPAFYSEAIAWGAVAAAFAIVSWQLRGRLPLPDSAGFWLAIAAYLLLTPVFIDYAFPSQWQAPVFAFLGAAAIAVSATGARRAWPDTDWPAVVAAGLVLGATLLSITGWWDLANVTKDIGFLVFDGGRGHRVFGNIAQFNLYAHYLAWGAIAATWLAATRLRRGYSYAACGLAVWLLVAASWSESRSLLGYLAIWWLVALAGFWRERTSTARRFLLGSTVVVALGLAAQMFSVALAAAISWLLDRDLAIVTGLDVIDRAGYGARRLVEWKKGLLVFAEHPLLGVGWGGFPEHSFGLHARGEFVGVVEDGLFSHSHNLVINFLAELGTAGMLWLLAASGFLARLIWRARTEVSLLAVPILGVTLGHSMLEYPLWDFHFLAIFALMIALLESPDASRQIHLRPVLGPLIGGGLVVVAIGYGYAHHRLADLILPHGTLAERQAQKHLLQSLRNLPLFSFPADLALINYQSKKRQTAEERMALTRRLARYQPRMHIQAKLVCELGMAGKRQERDAEYRRMKAAFPNLAEQYDEFLQRYDC